MSTSTFIALLLLGSVLLWVLVGLALRLFGLLLFFAGLLQIGLGTNIGDGILAAAAGGLLWLLGHWHFALRHQEFKSPMARHLFARLPASLNPVRSWGIASVQIAARPGRRSS